MKIIKLLKAELFKESKRIIHYILLSILVVSCFLTTYYSNKNYVVNKIKPYELIQRMSKEEYKSIYKDSSYKHYISLLEEYNKDISNDNKKIEYKNNNNLKEKFIFEKIMTISLFISLIISIVMSGSIANEYNKGTIKTILTKPVKRYKILLSKILCSLIITITYCFILLLFTIIFMKIICDINIFELKSLNDNLQITNYFGLFLLRYIINIIPVMFISIFVITLSSVLRNVALISGITIFLSLLGSTISTLLLSIKIKFIQYTFLPYLDFTILENKEELFYMNNNFISNISIKNGIIILIVYSIVFIFLSTIIFTKKDIVN